MCHICGISIQFMTKIKKIKFEINILLILHVLNGRADYMLRA